MVVGVSVGDADFTRNWVHRLAVSVHVDHVSVGILVLALSDGIHHSDVRHLGVEAVGDSLALLDLVDPALPLVADSDSFTPLGQPQMLALGTDDVGDEASAVVDQDGDVPGEHIVRVQALDGEVVGACVLVEEPRGLDGDGVAVVRAQRHADLEVGRGDPRLLGLGRVCQFNG